MKKVTDLNSKIDSINLDALTNKSIVNRQIWKKEILSNYRTEKTARRILRHQQIELSKSVVKFAKLKDDANLKTSVASLELFYKNNLVTRSKFTNISDEKTDGVIINVASEIALNTK